MQVAVASLDRACATVSAPITFLPTALGTDNALKGTDNAQPAPIAGLTPSSANAMMSLSLSGLASAVSGNGNTHALDVSAAMCLEASALGGSTCDCLLTGVQPRAVPAQPYDANPAAPLARVRSVGRAHSRVHVSQGFRRRVARSVSGFASFGARR